MLVKTEREKKLLIFLGTVIFVVTTLFVFSFLKDKASSLKVEKEDVLSEVELSQIWLSQKDIWDQRNAWLDKSRAQLEGESLESYFNNILEVANEESLEVIQSRISESEMKYESGVSFLLRLRGSLEGLVKFLHKVQQPEKLVSISSFTCVAGDDAGSVECTMALVPRF